MNSVRECGCKGVRTCIDCEHTYKIKKIFNDADLKNLDPWSYCSQCDKLYEGWNVWDIQQEHPNHGTKYMELPGIFVKENFLTIAEGETVAENADSIPWSISQSGRRKQNYGPKVNFKKRKLSNGLFKGFPASTAFIQDKLNTCNILSDFQAIEQCFLEYDPVKGASIDPHIDDCWVWGERIVTVNCLGDSVLTLTQFNNEQYSKAKYNLNLLTEYSDRLHSPLFDQITLDQFAGCVIRLPMPNLSMMVLYGPARYQFEHAVLREDIIKRRVCIAYREFTPAFIDGNEKENGMIITRNARNFFET